MKRFYFKIEKRGKTPIAVSILNPVVFVLLAMAFSGIFIKILGFSPVAVYVKMLKTAFFTPKGLIQSILYSIPLMLCGLGVSISFRMNLNNLGAEGQYAIGAIASGGFALFGPDMALGLKLVLAIIIGVAAGAVWAVLASIPKALWNVNETIITLMTNYIALLLLDYLCYGPWMNSEGLNLPYSSSIAKGLFLPELFGTGINIGFLIAIVLAILIYWFFKKTTSGYQISVIKNSLNAARYAGINIKRNILVVMAISGALAGIAGVVKVFGITHRLQPSIAGGAGFTAIVIAYLSRFNPLAVILVSIFFGGLNTGSYSVQISGVPSQIATMIQGSILVFVLAGEFFTRNKIIFARNTQEIEKGGAQ